MAELLGGPTGRLKHAVGVHQHSSCRPLHILHARLKPVLRQLHNRDRERRGKQSNATLLNSQAPFCFLALYFPGIICPTLFLKPVSFQKLFCVSLISFHPRTKNNQTQHDVVPRLQQRRISSCAAGGSSPRGDTHWVRTQGPPWWGCTADLGRKHSDHRRTL